MKRIVVLLSVCICLADCAMYAGMARSRYAPLRIAFSEARESSQVFRESGFRSILFYKTSRSSSFNVDYFRSMWGADLGPPGPVLFPLLFSNVSIESSLVRPGESFVSLANLFPDAMTEENGEVSLVFYLIEKEQLLSRKLTLTISLDKSLLFSRGTHRSDDTNPTIRMELKDRTGKIKYSTAMGSDCFVELETRQVEGGVLSAAVSAALKSRTGDDHYRMYEGELWLKLQAQGPGLQ